MVAALFIDSGSKGIYPQLLGAEAFARELIRLAEWSRGG